MEARRAIDTVAIEKRERGIPEIGGTIDEGLGQRRALKKSEGRGGVEFDVHNTINKIW